MEEQVRNLFIQGYKLKDISSKTGLNIRKVEYLVYEKLSLPRRRKELNDPNRDRILYLFKWGYEPEEISEGEGIKLKTVKRIINGNQNLSKSA